MRLAVVLIGDAIAALTKLVIPTLRVRTVRRGFVDTPSARPVVFVGWHGHLAQVALFAREVPGARGVVLVRSDLRGRILSRFASHMRIDSVALGHDPRSSTWARGTLAFIAAIRAGAVGILALDGPDGPAYRAKPGAAFLARRVGALLIPTAVAADPAVRLPRWDRALLPLPFARVALGFGPPISLDDLGEGASLEQLTERIEAGVRSAADSAAAALRSA